MFSLRRPDAATIERVIAEGYRQPFSYDEVGGTRETLPPGYRVDRHRVLLGHGDHDWIRAVRALESWKMFPREMVRFYDAEAPFEPGVVVAVMAHTPIGWSLNPARVVYTIDQCDDPPGSAKFGLAYGTLPGHALCGEERFMVERMPADDSVWYDLLAFSRPAGLPSRLGWWYVRWQQARFRRLSGRAMQRAVQD